MSTEAPRPDEVIAYLMREQAGPRRFRCLLGNHGSMLSVAANPARTDADLAQWWANGGEATLDAYGWMILRSTSGPPGMDKIAALLSA
jgi:hypothetical protein